MKTLPISRRKFLQIAASSASALHLSQAARAMGFTEPTVCKLVAEQEVGPYYVANEMVRHNIRENKPGFPLTLDLIVLDSRSCQPLANAAVDVWHCDALGLYSGFTSMVPMGPGVGGPGGFDPQHPGSMPPPPPGSPGFDPQHPGKPDGPPEGLAEGFPAMKPTDKLTFLRGIQFTDSQGRVRFETIFPGFYPGRTNHVHMKVRLGGHTGVAASHHTYLAGHTAHTGQVFFPEEMAATLMKQGRYAKHAIHRTTQAEDRVFKDQHGEAVLSHLRYAKANDPEGGLLAELVVAVDPTATPDGVGIGAPPA